MRMSVSAAAVALALVAGSVFAHCEIPCGIYDDPAKITEMRQDVTTLEKSMKAIVELSAAGQKNYNQLIRWVTNKEDHANKLQDAATQYFMFQRIKPAEPGDSAYAGYIAQLTLMHKITVHAMKAKQTTDLAEVETLRKLIDQFEAAYLKK